MLLHWCHVIILGPYYKRKKIVKILYILRNILCFGNTNHLYMSYPTKTLSIVCIWCVDVYINVMLFCLFCRDILLHCVNGCQLNIIVNVKMGLLWKQGHYTHIYATVALEVYPEGLLRIQLLKDVYRPYGLPAKRLFVCVCISFSNVFKQSNRPSVYFQSFKLHTLIFKAVCE